MGRAIGIVRVSTDKQSLSVDAQAERLEAWSQANGYDLEEIYEEKAVCSTADIMDRCVLLNAIADLDEGSVLLATDRDRLSREPLQYMLIKREVGRMGASIMFSDTANLGNGSDDPMVEFFETMSIAAGKLEKRMIAKRTRNALQSKAAKGEKLGGRVPYGYEVELNDNGKKIIVTNEPEQIIVAMMREWKNTGLSLAKISDKLSAQGIVNRSGSAWNRQSILNALNR